MGNLFRHQPTIIKALALVLIMSTAATALVSTGTGQCRLNTLQCTANDITPGTSPTAVCTSGCIGANNACTVGSTVTVVITEGVQFTTNANRYDFVYTTKTGGSSTTCTAEVPSPSSPFVNLDSDKCGDLNLGGGGTLTYTLSPVDIACADADNSGTLDWNVCVGYATAGKNDCTTPLFAVRAISPSKCKCATINLPIYVVSCTASTCPSWNAPGYTWPAGSSASDTCVGSGTCSGTSNCAGSTDGYCLTGQGANGALSCFYKYTNSSTVCRPSAGDCDKRELCTGSSSACPSDTFKPSTFTCRGSQGACDSAETCTGSSALCPQVDLKYPSGYVCRASGGVCDPQEVCDGVSDTCPADVRDSTTVCRPSAGCCDPAEKCDGVQADCPADLKSPSTAVCLRTLGVSCSETVYCDGTSPICPKKAVDNIV